MSKTGLTIKGGNVTRLGLLSRVLDLTDKLQVSHYYDGHSELEELKSKTGVYKAVAEAISTIDTNGQGINITGCNFQGLDVGMKVEQSPEENLEETTEEGIIEEDYDNEGLITLVGDLPVDKYKIL
jgi:hypothetical protein